jgi:hypothetical protein
MDEMAQVMQDFEQQLEVALMELEVADVSQKSRDVIRHACGKPYPSNVHLKDLFVDFGTIFGGKQ